MKTKIGILVLLITIALLGCEKKQNSRQKNVLKEEIIYTEQPFLREIEYSNLVDEQGKEELKKAFLMAGIEMKNIESFFQSVNIFNQTVGDIGGVSQGFKVSKNLKPTYDEVAIIERWESKYPEFPGYNCRITSFQLLKDFVNIRHVNMQNSSNLFVDQEAIDTSPEKIFTAEEYEKFKSFYSQIPTTNSKDVQEHIKRVKKDWEAKGIAFPHANDPSKASLISVFFHASFAPEDNHLFIGHIGVLVPTEDNQLLFVEKLAFEEPYQVIKLNNRTELNDLLMNRYDVEWGQPHAKPFIFENDQLLQGYRPNPNNTGAETR